MFSRTVFCSWEQKTPKKHVWKVGVLLVLIGLHVFKSLFSKNNKMLFPLFFLLFKEQKNGSSLYVFNMVFSCFLCDFSYSVSSTFDTSTMSLSINEVGSISTNTSPISIISKYFEFFFFGRSKKLVGKKLDHIFFNNFYELLFLVGLFYSVFRT